MKMWCDGKWTNGAKYRITGLGNVKALCEKVMKYLAFGLDFLVLFHQEKRT